MYKRLCNKEYEYSENKDIELIKLIIEKHNYDENFTKSMGIYFTGSFESSNELVLCLLSGVGVRSVDSSHSSVYLQVLKGEWDTHSHGEKWESHPHSFEYQKRL